MENLDPSMLPELLMLLTTILGSSHPIVQAVTLISSLIGGASLATKLITKFTKITPNTKDDAFASSAERSVAKVVSVIDKLALNPNAKQARRE